MKAEDFYNAKQVKTRSNVCQKPAGRLAYCESAPAILRGNKETLTMGYRCSRLRKVDRVLCRADFDINGKHIDPGPRSCAGNSV